MPKSNEDSSVSLNKPERPPLKRPKTLSIPSSTSTTNRRFDLGVSIENGSPASGNGDFPNEQWKYPSFLGTTRRKRTTVKPNKIQKLQFSDSMGSKMGGDQKKAGNSSVVQAPPANSSSTTNTSSTSFSSSPSTSVVTLLEHSSTTRPHQNKHTSILYLVSDLFAVDIILFYLLFSPFLVKKNHFK